MTESFKESIGAKQFCCIRQRNEPSSSGKHQQLCCLLVRNPNVRSCTSQEPFGWHWHRATFLLPIHTMTNGWLPRQPLRLHLIIKNEGMTSIYSALIGLWCRHLNSTGENLSHRVSVNLYASQSNVQFPAASIPKFRARANEVAILRIDCTAGTTLRASLANPTCMMLPIR